LVFLVDGKRLVPRLDQAKWQWAYYDLPTEDLLTMIASRKVEGRVNFQEFILSDKKVRVLAEFASMLKP
jgi:hypothetical protein